jgi:hypothetical protein
VVKRLSCSNCSYEGLLQLILLADCQLAFAQITAFAANVIACHAINAAKQPAVMWGKKNKKFAQ